MYAENLIDDENESAMFKKYNSNILEPKSRESNSMAYKIVKFTGNQLNMKEISNEYERKAKKLILKRNVDELKQEQL